MSQTLSSADVFVATQEGVQRLTENGRVKEVIRKDVASILLAYDPNGILYFQGSSPEDSLAVFRHDLITGVTSTFIREVTPKDMTVDGEGNLYLLEESDGVSRYNSNGILDATIPIDGMLPRYIDVSSTGELLVAGFEWPRTGVSGSGSISTLNTDGRLSDPLVFDREFISPSIVIDPVGTLFSHDYDTESRRHFLRPVNSNDSAKEYELEGMFFGMTFSPKGDLFYSRPLAGSVIRVDGVTGAASTLADGFLAPMDVAVFPSPVAAIASQTIIDPDIDRNGTLDTQDIDRLSGIIREGLAGLRFDIDQDGTVGPADIGSFVLKYYQTGYGDANLDGVFDSRDLVIVLQQGAYDNQEISNVGWGSGDWDGSGTFDSSDLVLALRDGRYLSRSAVSVPEPAWLSIELLWVGAFACAFALRWR